MDYTNDAIFKAGKIHGCEDELYLIYLNADAETPLWEIAHISRYDVLDELENDKWYVEGHAGDPDWYRVDMTFIEVILEMSKQFCEEFDPNGGLTEYYSQADYIYDPDGDGYIGEAEFIANWAKGETK